MSLRTITHLVCSVALWFATATIGSADALHAGGSWQTWTAGFSGSTLGTVSAPNYDGGPTTTTSGPYWNNASGDAPVPAAANIGWCLAGGGQCTLANGSPGTIPFYGGSNGSAIPNIYFTGRQQITASLEASLTSQRANDLFGYYTFDPNTGAVLNTFPLFSASSAPGTTSVTFTPATAHYGFYIENTQGNPLAPSTFPSEYFFYTDANDNNVLLTANPTDNLQHFAIFSTNSHSGTDYYLGAVDTRACSAAITSSCLTPATFDYQDMVVGLSFGPNSESGNHKDPALSGGQIDAVTPEPSSFKLLGLSLFVILGGWLGKRTQLIARRSSGR
jgi:hypothetical protein